MARNHEHIDDVVREIVLGAFVELSLLDVNLCRYMLVTLKAGLGGGALYP